MVTRDEVRWGYLLLFGREPESEQAYLNHGAHADLATLRRVLIQSPEGLHSLRTHARAVTSGYDFNYFRSLLVFIHMEKTGGTTLYDAVVAKVGAVRSSPPHLAFIPELTLGELNHYDFVSGHFNFQEAMALPRSPKTCITLFREPFARLISFYRFHRAHGAGARDDPFVRLAQDLEPADFFRHDYVRSSARINHLYVRIFASLPEPDQERTAKIMSLACRQAIERIGALDAFGLTEDMDGSSRLLSARIGFDIAAQLPRIHSTDTLHRDLDGFSPVAKIEMSAELRSVMMPLVAYDLKLYAHAATMFRQRLAALDGRAARTGTGSSRLLARIRRS